MKWLVILSILAQFLSCTYLFGQNSSSQHQILFQYNELALGENLGLSYKRNIGKSNFHSIIAGITWHINDSPPFDEEIPVFFERAYAEKFMDKWGLNLEYQFKIPLKSSSLTPILFYSCNLNYLGITNNLVIPYIQPISDDPPPGAYYFTYVHNIRNTPKMFILEQNVGVGFYAKVYKTFGLFLNGGIGVGTFFGIPETFDGIPTLTSTNGKRSLSGLAHKLTVGVYYSLP